MKKLISLVCIFLTFYSSSSFASHILGGEISWTCLSTGQYIFSMSIYRDCTGVTWTFENEVLDIVGSPLPSGGLNSIIMEPDQTKFQNSNNGDTSPDCTPDYGEEYTCPNEDQGTVQAFFYKSRPVTLSGTPPGAGWRFYWESPCCRPYDIENIITPGDRMLLRAIMYPGPNGLPADPCFDSSPEFRALPTTLICRGYEFTYNHTAVDYDLDELVYSWSRPFNPPIASPQAVPYAGGYSPQSPTPGTGANINNIPATLDPLTGITRLAVYSGTGVKKFVTVVRVDSYSEGVRTASIFREIPISIFDCPTFPNGQTNNVPQVKIDGIPTESKITNIVAGQTVSIPVQVEDNDITGVGSQLQILTMVADGLLFNKKRRKDFPCDYVNFPDPDVECAYLQNQTPFDDNGVAKIQGLGVIGTEFVWKTDCRHISTFTGFPGTNEGIYNFVMRVSDDHCPIPALNYPTITVRVKDPIPLTDPIMIGASVGLDGAVTYNWAAPVDSATDLFRYEAEFSKPVGGGAPLNWNTLNPNIKDFAYSKRAAVTSFPVYDFIDPFNPVAAKLPDPLGTFQGIDNDFYIRMRAISGCTDDIPSAWSEPVRVMELNAVPAGTGINPARSVARLTWNRPKPVNAKTYPYYQSHEPTVFNIWANDSLSAHGFTRESDWYKIGSTTGTTFDVKATTCGDYVGFRIEAVDRVEFIRQGSTIQQLPDSAYSVDFSTFSMVDSMLMETNKFIPTPQFDTIVARADGSIFLRIDLTNKQTTSTYNIYETSVTGPLLATLDASKDSVVVIPGGLVEPKDLVLQAIDGCDPTNTKKRDDYKTFEVTGGLGAECTGEYILNWIAPTGFPNGVSGYRVYVDSTGNGYQLVTTITNGATTTASVSGIKRSTTYLFRVEAYELTGGVEDAVNFSIPHEFITPANLNNNDIVPPPLPRCTYVHDDGSVTLTWIPSEDTSSNFNEYDIKYRIAGSTTWTDATGEELLELEDNSYRVNGINAQAAEYEFALATLSGCKGDVLSSSNNISSVFITATPNGDAAKTGTVQWNPTGIDYGMLKYPQIYKDTLGQGYSNMFLTTAVNTNVITDNGNGEICDGGAEYYLHQIDSAFVPQIASCEIRSNLTSARYIDSLPPDEERILYVSYNLATNGIDVYWENDNTSGTDTESDFITVLTTDGFNSGLQNYRDVTPGADNVHDGGLGNLNTSFVAQSLLDASDSSVALSTSTTDHCGNTMDQSGLYFHRTMEVSVAWNICDSINEIAWNPYVGFDPSDAVEYVVYFDTTGTLGGWTAINASNPTNDTMFTHQVFDGGKNYRYHVRASTQTNPTYVSNSNIETIFSIYEDTPLYSYLQNVTVLPSNDIEVKYYRDTQIPVKGYTVFRGEDRSTLSPIAYYASIDLVGVDTIAHVDALADVDNVSYYYQVQTQNACDIVVDQSNFARSIHLSVQADNAGLINKLSWNRYEGWDSTVHHYNVYRGVDESPTALVYSSVTPNSQYRTQSYEDDVYGELFSAGKFCYRVEAVQGPVNDRVVNGYPNNLQSQVSNSNTVCVSQQPLFYVPNAFAPGGVNKLFGPKGQFFNFSLYEMTIYNRWGEQVYITRDINKGWDGTINGEEAGLGSYVYMIRFKDADGKEHRKKGTVTLIR